MQRGSPSPYAQRASSSERPDGGDLRPVPAAEGAPTALRSCA
jgi:hypothetical protein